MAVSPSIVTSGSAVRSTRPFASAGRTSAGQALGLPLRLLRELEGQRVLAQRDLDLDAGIGRGAQHFLHARDRFAVLGRLLDDLGDDDLADLRGADAVGGHQEVLVDAPVLGDDEVDAALLVEAADDLAVRARQHLDDVAFGAAAAVDAALAHDGTVAVQHLVHLARVQEEVVAAFVGHEEAEAVRMTLHGADREVELGDDAQLALAVGEELAVALHRGEPPVERVARDGRHAERLLDVGGRQGGAGVLQRSEDRVAGGDEAGVEVVRPRAASRAGGGRGRRGLLRRPCAGVAWRCSAF